MKLLSLLALPTLALSFTPPSFLSRRTFPLSPRSPITSLTAEEYGASGTSFYTTTEKQDTYDDLESVLEAKCKDENVKTVIREVR